MYVQVMCCFLTRTLVWFPPPDGQAVQEPHYVVMADNSLLITKTRLSDEGVYSVRVSNAAGSADETVRVTVLDPQPPERE